MQQNTSRNLILGGGISGLILQFYNPSFTIITPEVGGMFANSYVVWLHSTAETRQLLKDLGYQNVGQLYKRSYMGYYSQGWISEKLSSELNLKLIQKKMSNWNEPVDKSFIPQSYDMSTRSAKSVNYMNVLDVDPAEIIRKLDERRRPVISGTVVKITPKTITYKTVSRETTVEYDELLSTIPAPFFWKAWGIERTFRQEPITNIITKVRPKMFDNKFEMVYYADGVPFTRISHLQGMYAIEFTGTITKEEFEKLYPEYPIEKVISIKHGRIFQEENTPPQQNITFAGRFGKWEFGITTEWVIKQSIEYKQLDHKK